LNFTICKFRRPIRSFIIKVMSNKIKRIILELLSRWIARKIGNLEKYCSIVPNCTYLQLYANYK